MMRNAIKLLTLLLLLTQPVTAQVTTVVSPVAGIPKLNIPTTFAGKTKLVDSLKKANLPAGQILKTLIPKYVAQFQKDMIQGLTVLYRAGYSTVELGTIVKEQYPELDLPLVMKLFYAAYKEYISAKPGHWPLGLGSVLYEIYNGHGNQPTWTENDGWWQLVITRLEEGGDSLSTIFSYIKIYDLYLKNTLPESTISEIENYAFGFTTTRFPDSAVLKKIIELKGQRDDILVNYIRGVRDLSLPRIFIALKSINLTKEQIRRLTLMAGGFFANDVDAALQRL